MKVNYKKIAFVSTFLLVFLLVFWFFYLYQKKASFGNVPVLSDSEINKLESQNEDLKPYFEHLKEVYKKFKKDDPTYYADLGLAYKSLGDQTQDKRYYQYALDVYKSAIDLTKRKNVVFLLNAGNMEVYLGNYDGARKYYEEATYVAPGDIDGYQKLIELHIYYLKSPKDEILKIFDRGIERMVDPTPLKKWREAYIKSIDNKN